MHTRHELKICERCGGLWLRPAGSGWTYCAPCLRALEAESRPSPRPARRPYPNRRERAA